MTAPTGSESRATVAFVSAVVGLLVACAVTALAAFLVNGRQPLDLGPRLTPGAHVAPQIPPGQAATLTPVPMPSGPLRIPMPSGPLRIPRSLLEFSGRSARTGRLA